MNGQEEEAERWRKWMRMATFKKALTLFLFMGGLLNAFSIAGGNQSTLTNSSGTFTIITCTANCTLTVTGTGTGRVFACAAGGGGGSDVATGTGGGGAGSGGCVDVPVFNFSDGTLPVVIGYHGIGGTDRVTPGTSGTNTTMGPLNLIGGGFGRGYGGTAGSGGSGGAGAQTSTAGAGITGQGYGGGTVTANSAGAGGGGAGGVGGDASTTTGGASGPGVSNFINGTLTTFAKGGYGGNYTAGAMQNGIAGTYPGDGGAGARGGSSGSAVGGNGSDGIVIIAYASDGCVSLLTAGQTMTLTNDTATSGSCISLGAANTTVDCAGFSVVGSNTAGSYGVTSNSFNTTIKNCNFRNFVYGIYLNGATFSNVFNNTATNASTYGILMESASSNWISNNTITNISNHSVYLNTQSNLNSFYNNTVQNSTDTAFRILDSRNNNFTNNHANVSILGMKFANSNNSIMKNNTLIDINAWNVNIYRGLDLDATSYNNTFLGNNITFSTWIYDNSNAFYSNYYNTSAEGNIYRFINGTESQNIFNITSTTNTWADGGPSRPFNATTVGSNFSGASFPNDWHPWVGIIIPPVAVGSFYLCNATYTNISIIYTFADSVSFASINATFSASLSWINSTGGTQTASISMSNNTTYICVYPDTFSASATVSENANATGYLNSITTNPARNYSTTPYSRQIIMTSTTSGTFYTFQLVNQYSSPIIGGELSVTGTGGTTYYTTDITGSAYVALTQLSSYIINASASGYTNRSLPFVAGPSTTLQIMLQSNGTNIVLPNFSQVFGRVQYSLTPINTYIANNTTIVYTVYSNATLSGFGMNIVYTNTSNNWTQTTVFNSQSTNASGGAMALYVNQPGIYTVSIWFKDVNYENYTPVSTIYVLGGGTRGLNAAKTTFSGNNVISGWGYYFVLLVLAMLVGGFVSRYSMEGAVFCAWILLFVGSYINPDALVVQLFTPPPGVGGDPTGITTMWLTIMLGVLGAAVFYLKQYGT